MGRKAHPVDVILLDGKKHLTKEEIEERRAAEAAVKGPSDKVIRPEWLDEEGCKEWDRICGELKTLNLLTNVDVSALAVYCDLVSEYVKATHDVQERGLILRFVVLKGRGKAKYEVTVEEPNPSAAQAQKYAALIKSYLVEFGLSPSARAKLRPPKDGKKTVSEFDKRFGAV